MIPIPREFLTDGVLTLRRYAVSDAKELHEAASESVFEIYPWLPWCHPGYALAEAEAWITTTVAEWEQGYSFSFVFRNAEGRLVGGCGINSLHDQHPMANLGYWVRTSECGKGYAARATRLLAEFALRDLELQRVEIVAAVGNVKSQRVAEKAGATREGVLRNRLVLHDFPHDAVMYSLVPADFPVGKT